MSRVRAVIDEMHKEANVLSGATKFIANNPTAGIGAGLGGLYGAYKGSKGEDGGLKGALVGGAQGALGGGIIGGVGGKLYKGIKGVDGAPGVFGQYGAARKGLMDEAGVAAENRGFWSRNFGKGREQLKAHTGSTPQLKKVEEARGKIQQVVDKADTSNITAANARSQIDTLMQSNPELALEAARHKMVFGGLGAGLALHTGKKILQGGTHAGEGITDEQRMGNLRAKYQRTGQLDPREMQMLAQAMKHGPRHVRAARDAHAAAGGSSAV
jgi:hypothetical protein